MKSLQLADLVSPLSAADFIAQYWDRELPFLGRVSDAVVEQFRSDPVFGRVETLLPKLKRDVLLFGPDRFRAAVPPAAALDFLHNGYNLYISEIERTLPDAPSLFHDVARDLGIAPWQIHVEAFAGRSGGVSSRHFDHDINFQILLEGEKLWRLEPNENIQNPLLPYHPARQRDGSISGFDEEALATNREIPTAFAGRTIELHATAGTVVFLPRAYWHEVYSRSATWSLNVVVKGLTWSQALGNALIARLHRRPEFRAYCDGLRDRHGSAPDRDQRAADRFEELKAAAIEAVTSISRIEASLSGVPTRYRWSSGSGEREIVLRDGMHVLSVLGILDEPLELDAQAVTAVHALLSFRSSFSWPDVQTVNPDLGPIELQNLVNQLIDLKLLERL